MFFKDKILDLAVEKGLPAHGTITRMAKNMKFSAHNSLSRLLSEPDITDDQMRRILIKGLKLSEKEANDHVSRWRIQWYRGKLVNGHKEKLQRKARAFFEGDGFVAYGDIVIVEYKE